MTKRLTAHDVCEVTGYTRDQLTGLLKVLPPYSEQACHARVAREFNARDLHVLAVVFVLEKRMGIQRGHLVQIGERLHQSLSGPRSVNRAARLFVSISPAAVEYVDGGSVDGEGVLLMLGPVFEKVERYLDWNATNLDTSHDSPQQPLRGLGPGLIAERKRRIAT